MTELELLNGMDQSIPVDDSWILDRVDEIIAESIEKKDGYVALNACKQLRQIHQLAGVALAKFFYLIKQNWDVYEIGDNFNDTVADYAGVTRATVSKYVKIWSMYEDKLIPEEFEEEIRQKNIKDQVPISNLVSDGEYELDKEDWTKIVDAPDFNSVSREIRDITGKKPYSNALMLYLSDDGQITAIQDGKNEYVGFLDPDGGEISQKASQRIIKSAGIMQR